MTVQIAPDARGVSLALVEVYQRQGRSADAIRCLEEYLETSPNDLAAKAYLAELLVEGGAADREACGRVVRLAQGVANESPLHAALLLYKGMALRRLGSTYSACTALTEGLRRKKDRPPALLRVLRYERARACEDGGRPLHARRDYEAIYAEDPDYEDVAARLALGTP